MLEGIMVKVNDVASNLSGPINPFHAGSLGLDGWGGGVGVAALITSPAQSPRGFRVSQP